MSDAIEVKNLKKHFRVVKSKTGVWGRLRQFMLPEYEVFQAVDDISFSVSRGEKIAFIGPNGAGKSTTIKLLSGIYEPSLGSVRIFGKNPYRERKQVAYKIGTVFGQRSQLWYHLPAYHSFMLLATIYDLDKKQVRSRLDHLTEVFQLSEFLCRPVKELSLGQRMRCELVASLLHHPEVLFLDEPTIGLDMISKDAIRQLIQQRAELDSTVIFLTSHDIADIEKVCDRIILINKGKIVLDGSLASIRKQHLHNKVITLKTEGPIHWRPCEAITLIHSANSVHKFSVDLSRMSQREAVEYFARNYPFTDIVIENPPLEEIIKRIYQS